MKKIISLFIIFLLLFNLIPYSFAMETKTVDINSFDEFSVAQVQNVFSNSLAQEKIADTESEKETDNMMFSNNTDCNVPNFLSVNLKQPVKTLFNYDFSLNSLNYLYQYKLFEKEKLEGISEYKINQNTYMAVALFDMYVFVYI